MRVYLATTNEGKFREFQALLAPTGWDVQISSSYEAVCESDDSYRANAGRKAIALWRKLEAAGRPQAVLADDSGLEVDVLGNRPGILSARYGGAGASWGRRRALLLEELAGVPGPARGARFVCAVYFIASNGESLSARGSVVGAIATRERGAAGFSYDSLFVTSNGQTFAELKADDKNRMSHRGRAVSSLLRAIARSRTDSQSLGRSVDGGGT